MCDRPWVDWLAVMLVRFKKRYALLLLLLCKGTQISSDYCSVKTKHILLIKNNFKGNWFLKVALLHAWSWLCYKTSCYLRKPGANIESTAASNSSATQLTPSSHLTVRIASFSSSTSLFLRRPLFEAVLVTYRRTLSFRHLVNCPGLNNLDWHAFRAPSIVDMPLTRNPTQYAFRRLSVHLPNCVWCRGDHWVLPGIS